MISQREAEALGWKRHEKAKDTAAVVRWVVDCGLCDDALLGMPVTDYERGIVAPTLFEILGR